MPIEATEGHMPVTFRFTIPTSMRLFESSAKQDAQLDFYGKSLGEGDGVQVEDIVKMTHARRATLAMRLGDSRDTLQFLLVEEISEEMRRLVHEWSSFYDKNLHTEMKEKLEILEARMSVLMNPHCLVLFMVAP